ncbi:MAG: amidohydrolase family protein, partial [Gammaproteobacteria bacterium]|nr:amidohydrolase family protein [Gammaproteobacteria bacterium]
AAAEAVALARVANDRLAQIVRAAPDRYAGLATFAPQDPRAAALELERASRTLGLHGALVNSHTQGEYLDAPKYWPIFEALEALETPLYLHPREPSPSLARGLDLPGFTIGWGYAVETGTHALRLISAGLFDRFPRLKIVLGHLGEGIPFLLERIDDRFVFETRLFPRKVPLQRRPSEYFRANFWVTTSGMNFAAPLAATIATLGIERVLFAVDYPFEDAVRAVAALDSFGLAEHELRRLCETNARTVFRLRS